MKLSKHILITTLLIFYVLNEVICQGFEGDACVKDNIPGICMPFDNCQQAVLDLKRRKRPQICSLVGYTTIVCCIKAPTTPIVAPDACPPVPENSVKIKKTGQKAWDKCIDNIDLIHVCEYPNSLSLEKKKIRNDKCAHAGATYIVGGTAAKKNEFPHMVLLGFENILGNATKWDCGGTLVSDRWIMTAAHCTYNRATDSDVKHIRLGGGNADASLPRELEYTVEKIIIHPDYKPGVSYNDIALLQTDRLVKFSEAVIPACLHTGNEINYEQSVATGWGLTSHHGKQSKDLLKVTLQKFQDDNCSKIYKPGDNRFPGGVNFTSQLCIGHHTEAKDTCSGDSGGPLQIYNTDVYCTYTVIGVTSLGIGCGTKGVPGIYTKVSNFIPWIEKIVWP